MNALSGVVGVAAGDWHSLALKNDGTVWAWGAGGSGALGNGDTEDHGSPVQVSGLSGVVAVAGGGLHSLALKSDGTVWAWGCSYGLTEFFSLPSADCVLRPAQVNGLRGVKAVADGYNHSLALRSDGTVWAWGRGEYGQRGDGTANLLTVETPVQVSGLSNVAALAGGRLRSLAVKNDGTVWAWGHNAGGALGDGSTTNRPTPVEVSGLRGVVAVSGGDSHCLALGSDGTVWAWGLNDWRQLGDGTPAIRTVPMQVSTLSGVIRAAGGYMHSLAVRNDGTVWAWGDNYSGQLGDGTRTGRSAPVRVSGLSAMTAVAGGDGHSLALKSDGTVWAWGRDDPGELGDGPTEPRTTPVQVAGLSGVVSVACGGWHSLAVRNDGSVWAWGLNYFGELGTGSTVDAHAPVRVSGLNGVVAVAAGGFHSLALKSDGTVWAWGSNEAGVLGDGTQTQRTTPVLVPGLNGVSAVAAGHTHSMVLKSDGTVWVWGSNPDGRLGDGTAISTSVPVQIRGLQGVAALTAGGGHSLAVKTDGTVWAWGNDSVGQLGDGGTTIAYAPIQVSGLGGVLAASAGEAHSLAIQSDGTLWAWGLDYDGELGLGSPIIRTTPVETVPTSSGGSYTVSLNRSKLNFGAVAGSTPVVTPAQEVTLAQSGSTVAAWSAISNQTWLKVSPAAGTGGAKLAVSIVASALPGVGPYVGMLTIDSAGASNSPLSVPVTLDVKAASSAPYGSFDSPANNSGGWASSIPVTGWALDDVKVANVRIWRDPVAPEPAGNLIFIGDADIVPGARPDVETAHPSAPLAYRAGWGYMLLTNFLPAGGNGTYKLYAIAADAEGNSSRLGTSTITVDNAHAVKPFGALDRPAPGETISGTVFPNWGWALTPQPAMIPADGSTLKVMVDGVNLGQPTYGLLRSDIAGLFPTYANATTAVGVKTLDTTTLADGMHTIAWIARDNQGHVDGIGSRYFYVLNALSGAKAPAAQREA